MFPILDSRGNVIGFGGRVIGEGEPKYLNSPETPLFEKGRELYGLWQARRAIRDANLVIGGRGLHGRGGARPARRGERRGHPGHRHDADARGQAPAARRQRRVLLRRGRRRAPGGLEGARGVAPGARRRQVGRLPVPAARGRSDTFVRRVGKEAFSRGAGRSEAALPVPGVRDRLGRWTCVPRRGVPGSSPRRSPSFPRSRPRPSAP